MLLSMRSNFLLMLINFCRMSLSLIKSSDSNWVTALSSRNAVESLIVSENYRSTTFQCRLAFALYDFADSCVTLWETFSKRRFDVSSTSTWSIRAFNNNNDVQIIKNLRLINSSSWVRLFLCYVSHTLFFDRKCCIIIFIYHFILI
jgi:hypothetical protein